jgi:hypothetical protein
MAGQLSWIERWPCTSSRATGRHIVVFVAVLCVLSINGTAMKTKSKSILLGLFLAFVGTLCFCLVLYALVGDALSLSLIPSFSIPSFSQWTEKFLPKVLAVGMILLVFMGIRALVNLLTRSFKRLVNLLTVAFKRPR